MSKEQRTVTSDDIRIKDLSGGVFYDVIADMGSKKEPLQKVLRQLAGDLRKKFHWRGPWSVQNRKLVESETLEKLVAAGGEEGATLAKGLLGASGTSAPIELRCGSPEFSLQVASDGAKFLADQVQNGDLLREVLELTLPAVLSALSVDDPRKLGMQFRTVLRLSRGKKNFDVIGQALIPTLGQRADLFKAIGADVDFRRADQSYMYYRNNGDLLTQLNIECPGNDDNTTIWIEEDTQTVGEELDPQALTALSSFFDYHRSIINSLLSEVLPVDALDTTHPAMMVDRWFEDPNT